MSSNVICLQAHTNHVRPNCLLLETNLHMILINEYTLILALHNNASCGIGYDFMLNTLCFVFDRISDPPMIMKLSLVILLIRFFRLRAHFAFQNYPNPYPVRPSPSNASPTVGNSIVQTYSTTPPASTSPSSDVPATGAELFKSSTAPSSESPLLDAVVNVDAGGSSSTSNTNNNVTTTAAANPKRNVPLQLVATVPSDTSTFMLPIRVVVPIVHAHREIGDDTATDAHDQTVSATDDRSKHYLKFNYIVMRSNDPAYHAHLPNDTPERLVLVERSSVPDDVSGTNNWPRNGNVEIITTTPTTTSVASEDQQMVASTTDSITESSSSTPTSTSTLTSLPSSSAPESPETTTRIAGSTATPELHFFTDYGKHYVSLAASAGVSTPSEAAADNRSVPPSVRPFELPKQRIAPSQNRYHREFVYLEVIIAFSQRNASGC